MRPNASLLTVVATYSFRRKGHPFFREVGRCPDNTIARVEAGALQLVVGQAVGGVAQLRRSGTAFVYWTTGS